MRPAGRNLITAGPWPYFVWMAAGNALLSYASPGLIPTILLILFGVLLPATLAARRATTPAVRREEEVLPPVSWTATLVLLVLALFLRFHRLADLSVWPGFDDGVYSFEALEILRGGEARLFYGNSQAPPLFIWALALAYRWLGVSLDTLWLVPALFSSLFIPIAWWSARQWLSRSASFFIALLAGFSFWPLYLGRFSVMTISVLPFEALAIGALGYALKRKDKRESLGRWAFFGAALGTGFYTHLHYLAVAPILAAAAFLLVRKSGRPLGPRIWAALLPLVLVILPLLRGAMREGFGAYIGQVWAFQGARGTGDHLLLAYQYLASLFWGTDPEHCTYQPVWGGFLNPFLGALFFLGFGSAIRRFREGRNAAFLAVFILWLLPGLLTRDLDTFRLTPVLPVLLWGVFLGFERLCGRDRRRNLRIGMAILAAGFLLDAHHLFGAYAKRWEVPRYWTGHTKSLARARAYGFLSERAREAGPGLLFTRFVPGLPDATLEVACYGFNAVDNPRIDPAHCHWAAFLLNANYGWFLKKRYPHGEAFRLDEPGTKPDGGWILWWTPIASGDDPLLQGWARVHRKTTVFWRRAMGYVYGRDYAAFLPDWDRAFADAPRDPLLEALDTEMRADILFKGGALAPAFHPAPDGKPFQAAVDLLAKSLQKGPPFAHLDYRLAQLRLIRGETREAREALEAATRCPEDFTRAREELRTMRAASKEGKGRP